MRRSSIEPIEGRILFEDNHLIAINKRAGEIVQGDATGDVPLLEDVKAFLKSKYRKPGNVYLGLPHRLDRPTSGVVLFAKTSKALSRLNLLFRSKDIQKVYWAAVSKIPPQSSGTLVNYLLKKGENNKSYVFKDDKNGAKYSELSYQVLCSADHYHLIEVHPKTGRHHQIRVQLSHIGCPIKGDLKYGAKRSNSDGSIHLHARELLFLHPVKKEPVVIQAGPPEEALWNALLKLTPGK